MKQLTQGAVELLCASTVLAMCCTNSGDAQSRPQNFEPKPRFSLSRSTAGVSALTIIGRYAGVDPNARRQARAMRSVSLNEPVRSRECLDRAREIIFASHGLLHDDAPRSEVRKQLQVKLMLIAHSVQRYRGEAYHLLAMLSFRSGASSDATRYAALAAHAAPRSSRYASNFGYFLYAQGKRNEAKVVYEYARRFDPNNTATHLGLLALATEVADLDELAVLLDDWIARERVAVLRDLAVD